MKISDELVTKILYMARLNISDASIKGDLKNISKWMNSIEELSTEDIEETINMSLEKNKLRKDEEQEKPSSQDEVLKNAIEKNSNFFKLKITK